ncbi:MAG: class B sortase [Eubacteriales bacterium]
MKINNINFTNKTEYEAGLRDQAIIRKIKQKYDLEDPMQLRKLMQAVDEGEYRFESVIGRNFDDHLYELSQSSQSDALDGDKKQPVIDEVVEEKAQIILKQREVKRRVMTVVLAIVAVGSLGYSSYYFTQYEMHSNQVNNLSALKENSSNNSNVELKELFYTPTLISSSNEKEVERILLPEYEDLYNLNKRLIGWVTIADTMIDYPVLQTVNNEYYLTNGFDQNKDNNGSIFLDYRNDFANRDMNLILYGHNMKSGKMFGTLSKYKQQSYYKEHPIIEFDTIYEKGKYQIAYVFTGQIYKDTDIAFKYYDFIDVISEQEFDSNIEAMRELSYYDTGVNVSYGDELLTLSTCSSSDEVRFVVVAKRIQ